jgi:uncharacterized membrane protein YeaQ/YmgE (transglycosylase-associated protein family)
MILFLIVLIVMGFIIGALARFLVPGRDPMGVLGTILLGVAGTLVSGFIGRAFFGADGRFGSWIFALVITIILVLLVRRFSARGSVR